jgi:hypothetical protein
MAEGFAVWKGVIFSEKDVISMAPNILKERTDDEEAAFEVAGEIRYFLGVTLADSPVRMKELNDSGKYIFGIEVFKVTGEQLNEEVVECFKHDGNNKEEKTILSAWSNVQKKWNIKKKLPADIKCYYSP